jgi:hypothetical protein
MVAAERDTPGIRATHCTKPMITASFRLSEDSGRSRLPTRSAIHITALQPTSATTTTTHKLRRGPEIGPWARKPHDPNRYQAEDDIPSEPVVGRFAGLAVNEAAEPSAGQTSDVRAEVDDHRKDGAYLDDRGECGDAGIIDLQPQKSLRNGQMAGT